MGETEAKSIEEYDRVSSPELATSSDPGRENGAMGQAQYWEENYGGIQNFYYNPATGHSMVPGVEIDLPEVQAKVDDEADEGRDLTALDRIKDLPNEDLAPILDMCKIILYSREEIEYMRKRCGAVEQANFDLERQNKDLSAKNERLVRALLEAGLTIPSNSKVAME
ncbi:hypothetical protein C8Q77DRAFT_1162282 [Trametes polyzona]|nr:hypothetical protein C8Q77DRAFT_1162282 [Trametes polyzona]